MKACLLSMEEFVLIQYLDLYLQILFFVKNHTKYLTEKYNHMILYEQESSQVRIRAQNKSEKIEFN
jgi:hypothetical protein